MERGNRAVTAVEMRREPCVSSLSIHEANSQSIARARAFSIFFFLFIRFDSSVRSSFSEILLQHLLAKMRCSAEWIGAFIFSSVNVRSSGLFTSNSSSVRWPQSHRLVHWIMIVSSIYVNWRLNWNSFFVRCRWRVCVCAVCICRRQRELFCDILDSYTHIYFTIVHDHV